MNNIFTHVRDWYGRFERPISSLSLVGGFVFDAFTLRRVDQFLENFFVLVHIVVVAICIVWINRLDNIVHSDVQGEVENEKKPRTMHFWLVNILQFFFGGLLSVYLVFYFRSADFFVSWPFIFVLALTFWANESLKRHFTRLIFQVSLFFISLFSFAIFVLPVLLHSIGPRIFVLSGLVSIIVIAIFLVILHYASREKFRHSSKLIFISIISIFSIFNILYFAHLIPPIPLSLQKGGVYHFVEKNLIGNYIVTTEAANWKGRVILFFNFFPSVHVSSVSGGSLYAYSAIFSPTDLNTTIIHEWQQYTESTRTWKTRSRVALPVVGGREKGFRTYSTLFFSPSNLTAGKWRVNVETTDGQVIGSLRFTLVPSKVDVSLQKEVRS